MRLLAVLTAILGIFAMHISAFVRPAAPLVAPFMRTAPSPSSPMAAAPRTAQATRLWSSAAAQDEENRPYQRVVIEYCPGCRWVLRAGWLAQELLMTFQTDIDEVAIKPSKVSGTFDIYVNEELVFSRKAEGRFPEAKEVKQLVRNIACPDKGLGHSDTPVGNTIKGAE